MEPGVADAGNRIVVGVGGAGGDGDALAADVLGTGGTDAGLEVGVVSLVLVAVRLEVGDHAVSAVVGGVAEEALAGNAVVALVGSAGLASAVDEEEAGVAVALTVF